MRKAIYRVERVSTTLKMYGVPDESAYEVIALIDDPVRAELYAKECRNLCRIRAIRVVPDHLNTYGESR